MIRTFPRLPALAAALILLVTMPLTAFAGHRASSPSCGTHRAHHLPASAGSKRAVITFGVQGGNIRPWSVSISTDGSIEANGIAAGKHQLADPKVTLNGLLKLVDAANFFSMRSATQCSGVLPDIGSRYIEIHTSTDTKRVLVHGSCVSNFNQLYAVVQEIADIAR